MSNGSNFNPIILTTLQKVNMAQQACEQGVRFCVANGRLGEANEVAKKLDRILDELKPHKDAAAAALVLCLAKLMAEIENSQNVSSKLTRLPQL